MGSEHCHFEGCHLSLRLILTGSSGRVYVFVRQNGQCPASRFLDCLTVQYRKKFAGSFDALVKMGASYYNSQRFKPLKGKAKPLWEFKEFDHRLYCNRCVSGKRVDVVLLNGWVKDKRGKTEAEQRAIATALRWRNEFLNDSQN